MQKREGETLFENFCSPFFRLESMFTRTIIALKPVLEERPFTKPLE